MTTRANAFKAGALASAYGGLRQYASNSTSSAINISSFYGSSCANNSKGALNTPETLPLLSTCI
eukprot:1184303-Prorocentrum_minimum.AAC.1